MEKIHIADSYHKTILLYSFPIYLIISITFPLPIPINAITLALPRYDFDVKRTNTYTEIGKRAIIYSPVAV